MYEKETFEKKHSVVSVMSHLFFLVLSLCSLGLAFVMGYGMVRDDAAFMLFAPVILGFIVLGFIAVIVINFVTGDAVDTITGLFSKDQTEEKEHQNV